MDDIQIRAELKKLGRDKIADYKRYKDGSMTREQFIQKKAASDFRKKELFSALTECEAQNLANNADQRQYAEAFQIKEYRSLEAFDKTVMASLIELAKVINENCLEVTWKFEDIYKKILTNI